MRGHRRHGPGHCHPGPDGGCWCEIGRLRGFLEPVVVLLVAKAPCHGYDLLPRLGEFGMQVQGTDPGTLYRTLRRLEDDGILQSHWATDGAGPARRVYSVTREGYEFLRAWRAAVAGIQACLDKFLAACGEAEERPDRAGPREELGER